MKYFTTGTALLLPFLLLSQARESFPVYFDTDHHQLNTKAIVQLDSFWRYHQPALSSLVFELKGYCDNRGTDAYNASLSEKRVKTIRDYLLQRGVKTQHILSAMGYGETVPVNENRTEEEMQLNRRVDIFFSHEVNAAIKDTTPLKEKIRDESVKSGSNIVLRNINFMPGMHKFLDSSGPMLQELLDAMLSNSALEIRVEGHICCQPDTRDGLDAETNIFNLSEARAKAIVDFLISRGIAEERLSYQGFGHSRPLYPYPEQTEEERIANRRVEIKIIKK